MKCDPSHGYIPLNQAISVVYNACRHVSDTRTNALGIGGWGGGGGFGSILISSENVISYVLFVSFCVRLYKIGVEVSFFVSNFLCLYLFMLF